MSLIGNIIWIICGGLIAAIAYAFGGLVLCLTIVGIPFGLRAFDLAGRQSTGRCSPASPTSASRSGCAPSIWPVRHSRHSVSASSTVHRAAAVWGRSLISCGWCSSAGKSR